MVLLLFSLWDIVFNGDYRGLRSRESLRIVRKMVKGLKYMINEEKGNE